MVTTDASDFGVGAVLEQDGRPVAFTSRRFSAAEQRRYTSTSAKELAAVVHALREWRCYLEGGLPFTVRTDHNPNVYFSSKATLSRQEAQWSDLLAQYNFTWQHIPGTRNTVADALSRVFAGINLAVATRSASRRAVVPLPQSPPLSPLRDEVLAVARGLSAEPLLDMPSSVASDVPVDTGVSRGDPRIQGGRSASLVERIKAAYVQEPLVTDDTLVAQYGLTCHKGLWWHGGQVVVPGSEAIRDAILESCTMRLQLGTWVSRKHSRQCPGSTGGPL